MISDRDPNRVLTREEREELVLDLYFNENKTYSEIAKIARISPRDIKPIIDKASQEKERQAHKSLAVQAYELFSKGKTLLQVTIDLNLGQAQATAYYEEYLKLVGLGDITKIYLEFKGDVSYFVNLCKAAKAAKMGIPQVINLLRIANNYLPLVQRRYNQLQNENRILESIITDKSVEVQNLNDQIRNKEESLEAIKSECRREAALLEGLRQQTAKVQAFVYHPNARVPQFIMDTINNGLRQKVKSQALCEREKRKERYWICIKNNGAIPNVLLKFKEQREYYRQKGNEPMSQALKVMMNSIYGLFGSDNIFAFQDYRVAELVTAFARLKLLEMKQLANNQFQMNIIYGDTDSIFVSGINYGGELNYHLAAAASFTAVCKQTLGVDVDHQNTFVRSILLSKKHYIGIQADGKVIIKGMEGKKRDRPPFFNQVFSQLIDDYKNNNKSGLIFNVLKAFKQLEAAEVDPSLLAYSIILNKDPADYQHYTPQHKIGKSLNKEPGSLIKYYKTGQQEDGYKGYSTNYQDLDIDVYKVELWKLIKDVLRLLDCDVQKLEEKIFLTIIEDGMTLSSNIYTGGVKKKSNINNNAIKASNIQRNESLDKYRSLRQSLVMLALQAYIE